MTPTAMGLMSQIYTNTGAVQVQGGSTAYPVTFSAGGNPIVIPVKNQASGIYMTSNSTGLGVYLGMYKQISNHLKLNVTPYGIYYSIEGAQQAPDLLFRYPDGKAIWSNPMTRSFAENGRYLVVDGAAGFMRVDLMNLAYQPFAPGLPVANGYSLTSASTAINASGSIAAVAYSAPGGWGSKYFKVVDVNSCSDPLPATSGTPSAFNCKTVDMWPKLMEKVPALQSIFNVRFANGQTMTFDISYKDSANVVRYASYSMTAFGHVLHSKQYMAVGDSYISGEGAYSYRDGTNTERNRCHQSLVSYPYLLAADQSSFASVACSGAKIHNFQGPLKNNQNAHQVYGENPTELELAEVMENRLPGYVLQQEFIIKDNPEAITISLGGNDIGFGTILEKCIHPLKNVGENIESGYTCFQSYEDRLEIVNTINSKFVQLRSLYEDLRTMGTGGRRVYVVGYPQIAKVGGDCGLNVQMNAAEIVFARDLIAHLNSVIKRAADEAGVQYIDTEHAFDGHRLCEASGSQTAVNGFTLDRKPEGGHDMSASFHPNQLGHELLANAIRSQTSRLSKPMPAPQVKTNFIAVDPNSALLHNAPKANRPVRNIMLADGLVNKIMDRAALVRFVAGAADYFTKPGATYSVVVSNGANNTPLGNFVADSAGNINVETPLPAGISPGFQTLHIYGADVFGKPIDVQEVFFVAASPDDSDGDTIADSEDSCPMAVQSGVDADQDQIDDVCDQLLLPVVVPPTEPAGIIWHDKPVLPVEIQATSGP